MTRLLLPVADRNAGAGLRCSNPSLGAGHSVRDQVLEVERSPPQFEGFARHQLRRKSERARVSTIEALEDSCFPDELGHGFPPGVPVICRQIRPVTVLGHVFEIDGGGSGGNQEKRKAPNRRAAVCRCNPKPR